MEHQTTRALVIESMREFSNIPQDQKDVIEDHLKFIDNLIQDIEVDKDFIDSIENIRKQNFTQKQLE